MHTFQSFFWQKVWTVT